MPAAPKTGTGTAAATVWSILRNSFAVSPAYSPPVGLPDLQQWPYLPGAKFVAAVGYCTDSSWVNYSPLPSLHQNPEPQRMENMVNAFEQSKRSRWKSTDTRVNPPRVMTTTCHGR